MGFLSITLTFLGYVLVYASTANSGRFATQPWAGVFADAYDGVEHGLDKGVGNAGNIGANALLNAAHQAQAQNQATALRGGHGHQS